MIFREFSFTKGVIVGGLLGAAVSVMGDRRTYRMRRRIMRAGRNLMSRGNGLYKAVTDLF